MIGQIVVTVPEAKRLIAQAVLELPAVQAARKTGRIVLKSGTTVSAIAELLGVPPMRIGGRIVPGGARAAKRMADAPHIAVWEQGQWRAADASLTEEIARMGPGDLFITGANAIDAQGVAGLLAGIEGGSAAGKAMNWLWSEGIDTIIAVGLEKLIPGSITDICRQAGRKRVDKAMGMAVGILPVFGKIVTEKDAVEILSGVSATVIAAGGIGGAEGATTMLVEGTQEQVNRVFQLIKAVEKTETSGNRESLIACDRGGSACKSHLACMYKPQ
ncbi:MAG: hypothetical protein P4N41_22710 [Negativicutes bacterium]|nr:hypothetical protein [Negativicutes bacterium]